MKKFISILAICAIFIGTLISNDAQARVIYLKVRIGFLAKWSITLGDCKDGWGICLSFNLDNSGQNQVGYDNETNLFYLKVLKSSPGAKYMNQGYLEIKEDSQVDQKLLAEFPNFNRDNKSVFIKAGNYPIFEEGNYYVTAIYYYKQ